MKFSFIIPTFNEQKALKENLDQFNWLKSLKCEIIISDANSTDQTRSVAKKFADRIIISPKKLATQQNLGAKWATGDFLFFLYADIILPKKFEVLLQFLERNPTISGGGFRRRWKHQKSTRKISLFDKYADLRIWLMRNFPGDHLIFVNKTLFKRIGGFRNLWLMQDIDLCRRINKHQKLICIKDPVHKSPRRINREGYIKTYFYWTIVSAMYYFLPLDREWVLSKYHNYLRKEVR